MNDNICKYDRDKNCYSCHKNCDICYQYPYENKVKEKLW